MQIRFPALALACALSAPLHPAHAQLGVQRERNVPDVYAISNARIVPVSGPAIERGTVVVRRGVIAAVGANVSAPADARIIDGAGHTIYPGFIDGFGSLGMPASAQGAGRGGGGGRGGAAALAQQQSDPGGAPNSLYPVGLQPEVMAADLLRVDDDAFGNAHSAGFTSALTAPSSGIFRGQATLINLAGANPQELIVRSPVAMYVGFTPMRGFGYPGSLLGAFSSIRQMLLDAQRYGQMQQAYARNPRGMRRPDNDPSLAALQPVLAREIPVILVASSQREIERALDLAKEFNLRPIIAGGNEAHLVADRLKAENVPVLLTLNFPRRPAAQSPDADPEPVRVMRERAEAPRVAGRLAQAGVRFAFHSGGAPWSEVLNNVALAVENGLPQDQALRALTTAPAEILGVADRMGTIETGKIANLTMVRGNAFERGSGARVARVFIDGRAYEVRAPQAGQTAAATASGQWTLTVNLEGEKAVTLLLMQDGNRLRGTIQGALGTSQISNGSIEAGEFRFTTTVTTADGTEEGNFSGTIAGNSMRGTVQVVGHAAGNFTGTRPATGGRGMGRGQQPPQR